MAYRMIVLIKNRYGDGCHQSVSGEFVLPTGGVLKMKKKTYINKSAKYIIGFLTI